MEQTIRRDLADLLGSSKTTRTRLLLVSATPPDVPLLPGSVRLRQGACLIITSIRDLLVLREQDIPSSNPTVRLFLEDLM